MSKKYERTKTYDLNYYDGCMEEEDYHKLYCGDWVRQEDHQEILDLARALIASLDGHCSVAQMYIADMRAYLKAHEGQEEW